MRIIGSEKPSRYRRRKLFRFPPAIELSPFSLRDLNASASVSPRRVPVFVPYNVVTILPPDIKSRNMYMCAELTVCRRGPDQKVSFRTGQAARRVVQYK